MYYFTLVLVLLSCYSFSQIPAFPGAEGFGSNTPGGRGGRVIKVTNLNDHGPGSLREAVESEGPRMVVFTTGGIINLETELPLINPYITIAGQTAPGDGICLRGETLRIFTHDIVIRYMRFRPGDVDFGPPNVWENIDAVSVSSGYNIVIDHCSLSWAVDENINMWHDSNNITVQNCIIGEALNLNNHPKGAHSTGMLIGSEATNISIHHNLFAHNNDRNPHVNGHSIVDIRNNVIYNPGGIATDIRANRNQIINYVNNYVIKGPRTKIPGDIFVRNLKNHRPKLYLSGNIGINKVFKALYCYDDTRTTFVPTTDYEVIEEMIQAAPYPAPFVTTTDAQQALEHILEEAGAVLPRRDPVDKKMIDDIVRRSGNVIDTKGSLLAWPPFDAGLPFVDSDNDGMPNHWENNHSLNEYEDDSGDDADQDGYSNLEEYLNGTDPVAGINPLSGVSARQITEQSPPPPKLSFGLKPNYPNPQSDYTNISFTIDRSSHVTLRVFDRIGREVANLANSFLYEGEYEVIWSSEKIDRGLYLIVLASDQHIQGMKTILTR